MKNNIVAALFLFLGFLVGYGCSESLTTHIFLEAAPAVEEGQIWEYTMHEDNPFKDTDVSRYKVLKVAGGYVKYMDVSDKSVDSDKIEDFIIDTKLLEND